MIEADLREIKGIMETEQNAKSLFYPPGGILIWMIIYLELITFGIGIIAFVYSSKSELSSFKDSAAHLNVAIATINTIFLLTSGFFAAKSIHTFKNQQFETSIKFINIAMLSGSGFLVLKCFEYFDKMQHGFELGYNTFFTYYWLLTGFHFLHVLVGLTILFFMKRAIAKQSILLEDFEAGTAFWHLCDLIWLILFPILYLLF